MPPKPTREQREAAYEAVLGRVARGQSVASALRDEGLKEGTWYDDVAVDTALAERYARARARGIEVHAEGLIDLADAPIPTNERGEIDRGAVQQRQMQIDARKWMLSKLLPRKYGADAKIETHHMGEVGIRITPEDLAAAHAATIARLAARNNQPPTP